MEENNNNIVIYQIDERELIMDSTVKEFLTVQKEEHK